MNAEILIKQIETYSNAIIAFVVLQGLAYSFAFGTSAHFNCLVKTAAHLRVPGARHAIFGGSYPTASEAAGGFAWLLIPIGISLVLIVLGGQVFRRMAPRIAEDL